LGRNAVTTVPADEQGRITVEHLPDPGDPTLVVLQAGNVNSGASDSFGLVAEHYAGSPSWIHVDGAFGLWAAASPKHRPQMEGLDRADSWATDMHKWLNVTYDSAVAIVRRREDLARTFQVGAAYVPESSRLEPVHRGPDMSQRARAIETWAVLKSLGRSGVSELVDRTCAHAGRLAATLERGGIQVHNDVVLNQVLIGLDSDEQTEALLGMIQSDGRIWCGGSQWNSRAVVRISVSSWATTDVDIDVAAETILDCAQLVSDLM
jgi:glutamate/tyrosine decarboxylase-like PLP-dependent enzyme